MLQCASYHAPNGTSRPEFREKLSPARLRFSVNKLALADEEELDQAEE